MAYEYQYVETDKYWDWTGCSTSVTIPWGIRWCAYEFTYWCGIKWCKKWGVPYPCGNKWCNGSVPYPCGIKWRTFNIPYPCFVTRQITKTGQACKGSGGKVAQGLSGIPYPWDEIPDKNRPVADPIDPRGDKLYAIYRKGLITRHITRNGRVLAKVALEKINFPSAYDKSGYVDVQHSDGTVIKIPIGNVRYSEELTPGSNNSEKIMWAPVVAPTKYPGYDNNGYYVISGNDDNPFYYSGGLALATFSLEAIHGVSDYSIGYARRLVLFFLASEMWEGNGYLLRKPGFFNSNRNRNGESIIQGVSLEELLGFFLGIMFYLKAEDSTHPLYSEALRLRDDVLRQVSRGNVFSKYKHSFMKSTKDSSYPVKHYEFAYYATREYRSWFTEQLYISFMTIGSGDTRAGDNWYTPGFLEKWFEFEQYMMFLTSMILVLDGNIPENKKEWFAEVFMRHVIKASKTSGPDIEDLNGNLYMSVVGLLVNKYLNEQRDSWRTSGKLMSIWGDKLDVWRDMIRHPIPLPQFNALNESAPSPPDMQWQHNLPLRVNENGSLGGINHNPSGGIGRQFVWRYESDKYSWKSRGGDWLVDFPGWQEIHSGSSVVLGDSDNAKEDVFKQSLLYKGYKIISYVDKELIGSRASSDNQVEGAGLGLLFMRMLLTHINPERYPKPNLPPKYDKFYPVLPYVGAEPLSPQLMHNAYRYSSRSDCTPFEIHGDQDESLRIIKLGDDSFPSREFIVEYAGEDEKLVLKHGFISPGSEVGLYLDSKGTTWKRFDKAALASTVNDNGENILIVAERAEGNRVKNPFNVSCFLRRNHWLRLSIWKVPPFAVGQDPNPVLIDTWVSESRHCNAVKELDMTLLDKNHVAVIFRTSNDADRVRIFRIDSNSINSVHNELVTDEVYDNRVRITAAYNRIIVYSRQHSSGWRLTSGEWDGNNLVTRAITSIQQSELLDMTTVSSGGKQYVVAITKRDAYLSVYSYELLSDGTLTYKGEFNTVDGEQFLVGREGDYERASVSTFTHDNKTGFVIVGKGVARELRNEDGPFLVVKWVLGAILHVARELGRVMKFDEYSWKKTPKGLKIVYGYILEDGRPTIVSSNVLGSGESSAMRMLDVTGHMTDGIFHGVISAHKTKNYGGVLGMWSKNYLGLTFWQYRDPYQDQRWSAS